MLIHGSTRWKTNPIIHCFSTVSQRNVVFADVLAGVDRVLGHEAIAVGA